MNVVAQPEPVPQATVLGPELPGQPRYDACFAAVARERLEDERKDLRRFRDDPFDRIQ